MPRNEPFQTTRRRALKTLGTIGFFGLAGCQTDTEEQTPTSGNRTSPTTTTEGSERQTTQVFTFDPETPDSETVTHPSDPWPDVTPTGNPMYRDDPNWRMVSHDTGKTGHNPYASGPSTEPTVRWTFDAGGSYWDQKRYYYPTIVDGTVYVGSVKEKNRGLVAIDAETGDVEQVVETEQYLQKPTIIDGVAYTVLGSGLGAYDLADGATLWETEKFARNPSPPIRVGNRVVSGRDGFLFGFDAATGSQSWSLGDGGRYLGRPIIADGTIVQEGLDALVDLQTGKKRTKLPWDIKFPSLSGGELYGLEGTGIQSLDWETLEPRWSTPGTENRKIMGSSPGLVGDIEISIQTKELDEYWAVARDRETGEKVWSTPPIKTTPYFIVTDTETAFLVSPLFPLVAVDLGTGEIRWKFTPPGETALGCGVALADDLLVVADGSGKLWALE